MNNFTFYNPTKIYFGENSVHNLSTELRNYGNNILLAYGGGSIKKNGIYDSVIEELKKSGKNIFELVDIMPNPRTEKVYEGIEICRDNNIDFILAVGGGSVIDCAKAIASGTNLKSDFWETLYINQESIETALPLGCILTLAATGSEMDAGGVITNWEKNIKTSYEHPLLQPKFSILDPTYTFSVPKNQTIYGSIDIISHIFEIYFSKPDISNVSDDLSEGLLKNVIDNLVDVLQDLTNYNARGNLMWASSMALNGILKLGKEQDWMSHQIEHALSAFYDIPHGAGLAIVHPTYMEYICEREPNKFARFARNVWGIDPTGKTELEQALEGIRKTKAFFKKIGAPTTLKEVGIPKDAIDKIVETINIFPTSYANSLTNSDIKNILNRCAE